MSNINEYQLSDLQIKFLEILEANKGKWMSLPDMAEHEGLSRTLLNANHYKNTLMRLEELGLIEVKREQVGFVKMAYFYRAV